MQRFSSRIRTNRTPPDRRAARIMSRLVGEAPTVRMGSGRSAIAELESVLERHTALALLTDDSNAANELRAAVHAIAIEARADDPVRCERMLLALRCAWRDFPEVRRIADQPIRDALWTRLVRLSCEEFYGRSARLALVS